MRKLNSGWGSGLTGVVIFSGSLPATRIAVQDFTPVFLTSARAVIAGLIAAALLILIRQPRPRRWDIPALGLVAGGVVIGFPLLTALALQYMTAARSIVFVALLPLVTAAFGVLRGGERPNPAFWVLSLSGGGVVAGFAIGHSGPGTLQGDLLMSAAIAACGLGYAEGGVLARRLGGWQVICWSLVLAAPLMGVLTLTSWPESLAHVTVGGWLALGYVSVFSMLIGFVFWYRGLAVGGVARVGQLQLLQPLMGLALAGVLLGEPVHPSMALVAVLVAGCLLGARRFG